MLDSHHLDGGENVHSSPVDTMNIVSINTIGVYGRHKGKGGLMRILMYMIEWVRTNL